MQRTQPLRIFNDTCKYKQIDKKLQDAAHNNITKSWIAQVS